MNATINLLPSVLSSRNIALSVESDVAESISVQELHSPFQDTDQASQNAEQNCANHVAITCRIALSSGADLTEELNNSHEETAETDASKAVCHCALEGTSSCALGHGVGIEVPRAVDTGDGGVDSVLQPFGDPVHGKRREGNQTNDLAITTSSSSIAASCVGLVWCILHVDGDESD